jgi:hypothetical protein
MKVLPDHFHGQPNVLYCVPTNPGPRSFCAWAVRRCHWPVPQPIVRLLKTPASLSPRTRTQYLEIPNLGPEMSFSDTGHLGKPANESGMQGWQLATPQSYALLRMFAYATLLCTHTVYYLQHPCRPSSSCCTSAVWACVCVFGVCVYVLIYIYIYVICIYVYIYIVLYYIYIYSLSRSLVLILSLSLHTHTHAHTHTHTHARRDAPRLIDHQVPICHSRECLRRPRPLAITG